MNKWTVADGNAIPMYTYTDDGESWDEFNTEFLTFKNQDGVIMYFEEPTVEEVEGGKPVGLFVRSNLKNATDKQVLCILEELGVKAAPKPYSHTFMIYRSKFRCNPRYYDYGYKFCFHLPHETLKSVFKLQYKTLKKAQTLKNAVERLQHISKKLLKQVIAHRKSKAA